MPSKYLTHHILRTQRKTEFAASGDAKQAANSDKEEANPRTACSSPSTALPALFSYISTVNSRTSAGLIYCGNTTKREGKVSGTQNPAINGFIPQD